MNNNNNNNMTGVDVEDLDMGMELTDDEFFALVPQPSLTSSGYPLHFPSMEVVHISSSDSSESDDEEEEEEEAADAAATGNYYYNDVSYLHDLGCSDSQESDDEDEDNSLYDRKRYTSCEMKMAYDEDIPMDISDSESEEDAKYKSVPLQRSFRYDGRTPFQELEEGEIDESGAMYQRQTSAASIENIMWEIDEIDLIAQLESQLQVAAGAGAVQAAAQAEDDDDYSDLPDLIPMEVCSIEEPIETNKRKRSNE